MEDNSLAKSHFLFLAGGYCHQCAERSGVFLWIAKG